MTERILGYLAARKKQRMKALLPILAAAGIIILLVIASVFYPSKPVDDQLSSPVAGQGGFSEIKPSVKNRKLLISPINQQSRRVVARVKITPLPKAGRHYDGRQVAEKMSRIGKYISNNLDQFTLLSNSKKPRSMNVKGRYNKIDPSENKYLISKISTLGDLRWKMSRLKILANNNKSKQVEAAMSALKPASNRMISQISGGQSSYFLISEITGSSSIIPAALEDGQAEEAAGLGDEDFFLDEFADNSEMDFIVSLDVNYEETNVLSTVRRNEDGDLLVPLEDVLRFEVTQDYLQDATLEIDDTKYVNLAALTDAEHDLNQEELSLDMNFPIDAMKEQYYNARRQYGDNIDKVSEPVPSIFYNYDYTVTNSTNSSFVAGSHEINYANKFGTFTSAFFSKNSLDYRDTSEFARLDTYWISDYMENNARLKIGDSLTRNSDWSNSTRFGGIQYSTNFDLRPNLITYPLATFEGSTALPSVIDIFADDGDRAVFSQDINTGKYFIDNIPTSSGSGEIRIKVKDINGREKYVELPIYVTSELMKEGISDFSYSIGMQRQEFGKTDHDYDGLVTSADYIYGVSDNWTTEFHIDTFKTNVSAGFSNIFKLGNYGVINGSLATNLVDRDGANGQKLIVGYRYQGNRFSMSAGMTLYRGEFVNIFAPEQKGENGRTYQANMSYGAGDLGNFSLSYSSVIRREVDTGERKTIRILGAGYQKKLNKSMSLRLSGGANMSETVINPYATLSLSINMENATANFSNYVKRNEKPTKNVSVNYSNSNSPWAWKIGVDDDEDEDVDYEFQLDYKGQRFNSSAYAFRTNEQHTYQADFAGSIVAIDSGLYVTKPINDSFALVKLAEIEGSKIFNNNRLAGYTDKHGKVLIPDLSSYTSTIITVDEENLPLDAQFSNLTAQATAPYSSGILVNFDVKQFKIIQFSLIDPEGDYLPVNSDVEVEGLPEPVLTGYNGLVYIEDGAHLSEISGRACRDAANCCVFDATIGADIMNDEIIDLEDVVCY